MEPKDAISSYFLSIWVIKTWPAQVEVLQMKRDNADIDYVALQWTEGSVQPSPATPESIKHT